MNILLKIFLTILFIPVFLVLLVLISVKFQFLNSNFWIDAFEKNGTYQKIESVVPKIIDFQSKEDGEMKLDKKITEKLLTRDNLKEFIETNIKNTLSYANGKSDDWIVFIPSQKLPKGLLPNFLNDRNEVSMDTLTSFINRGGGNDINFTSQISLLGRYSTLSLFIWSLVVLSILFVLYVTRGASIALIISGAFTLLLTGTINIARVTIENELVTNGQEPAQRLLGIFAPPIITPMIILWTYIAILAILLGIVLGYLQRNKKLK